MEVRFFAGAADAAGMETSTVDASGKTAADVVAALCDANERLATVLKVCALLADGVRVNDLGRDLSDVTRLDVLPPFAGG